MSAIRLMSSMPSFNSRASSLLEPRSAAIEEELRDGWAAPVPLAERVSGFTVWPADATPL